MSDKYWFYLKNDQMVGPIPEPEMKELFRNGVLKPETLIKSLLTNWTQAKKTKLYLSSFETPAFIAEGNIFTTTRDKQKNDSNTPSAIMRFLTRIFTMMKKIIGIRQ
jgi:GYF domain 2